MNTNINNRVTIQLIDTNVGYLDVKPDTNFPISYGVAEIRDLTERKGTFSKSITLANTKNNARLLNKYFDINIIGGTFNINKLQKCIVLQDNIPIVENAIMQLVGIKKVQKINAYDSEIEYTILVKEQTVDFFTKLGQKKLTDINFVVPTHNYTASYIQSTFTNTYLNTFKYVMPYSMDNIYSINEWHPGIYARSYWDKIFQGAGFTYDWSEIDNPDVKFNNLIIPFNGDSADLTQGQVNYLSVTATDTGFTKTTVPVSIGSTDTAYPYPHTAEIFDTEVSDPSNAYNPATGVYTNNIYLGSGNAINFKVSYRYDIQIVNNSGATATLVKDTTTPGLSQFEIRPYVGLFKNGNLFNMSGGLAFLTPSSQIQINNGSSYANGITTIASGTRSVNIANPSSFNIGDTIQVGFPLGTSYNGLPLKWRNGTTTSAPLADVRVRVVLTSVVFEVIPTINNISYNSVIDINNYIPKEISQADFIKSIVTMYNLFIDIDPNEPNKLIIKSRDKYYDTGKLVDWTKKLNKDREQTISWLAVSQKKKLILTYKEDKDEPNTLYKSKVNEIYGQQEFTFDNEYIKDIDKKELLFSPTPVTNTTFNAVTPYINGLSPKTNIRILYDGGTFNCDQYNIYNYGTTGLTNLTTYPLFSHFDKPSNPNFDINFGTCDYYYYNTFGNKTNNNLYNYHWRRTMNQLNKGHMLTAYFDLNAFDIQKMDLNDKIRIDNAYYNINQIIDYNPTVPGPTKVELLSIDNELEFVPFRSRVTIGASPLDSVFNAIKNPVRTILSNISPVGDILVVSGTGNSINNSGAILAGDNNTISDKSLTFGDSNNVTTKSLVIGDNNVVESKSIVLGNNVTVPLGLNNVLVVGDNITPTGEGIWTDSINGIPAASITSPDLATVLANGNITNGNDIVITTTDQIRTPDSTSKLIIDSVYALLNIDDSAGTNALVGLLPTTAALALNTPTDNASYVLNPGQVVMSTTGVGYDYSITMDSSGLVVRENIGGDQPLLIDMTGVNINVGLTLLYAPATNNTNTKLLTRNTTTGAIELRDVSSISGGGISKYAVTTTLNAGNNTITHSLGNTDLSVTVYDSTGTQIIPDEVYGATTTQITIRVSATLTGARVIVIG